MNSGSSRFPDPYRHGSDVGTATAFLIVLLLIVAVGAMLFFGNAWVFAPIDAGSLTTSALGVSSAAAAPRPAIPAAKTPVSRPTFAAPTPVPPLAGIPSNARPSATATPLEPGQPTPTPQGLQPPTPAPTQPGQAVVGNTGGDGVWLRHTPRMADHWMAWPDNTPLTVLGPEADGDGRHWLQVRDPKGDVGWVPAQFVSR